MSERNDTARQGQPEDALPHYVEYRELDLIPGDAPNLGEVILALQAEGDKLREMRAAGVELARVIYQFENDGLHIYALLFTTDRAVAERHGFSLDPIDGSKWDDFLDAA